MAGSAAAPASAGIFRIGSNVIIAQPGPSQTAVLPPGMCIRCGAAADGKPVTKWYYWHNPALYLLIFLGLLIYAIVALVVRKRMKVTVPLCLQPAKKRSIAVTLAWILPLVGIADAVILPQLNVDGGMVALISIALVLTGIVIWSVVASPIRPRKIDDLRGEFGGFCNAYLMQIPEGVPQAPMATGQMLPPPPPIVS